MKRVLLVTYSYPPDNTPAAERISKFAKYLPQYGWEPVILTARTSGANQEPASSLDSLEHILRVPNRLPLPAFLRARIRSGSAGYTTPAAARTKKGPALVAERLGLNVLFQEPWTWQIPAIAAGTALVKSLGIDCMLTSLKPVSTLFVGAGIHKRTGIPWIAEYRDPWSMSPYMHARRIRPLRLLEGFVEKRAVSESTHIVAVTEYWTKRLAEFHNKPATCIPHGFDPVDYPLGIDKHSCFTITYTGAIYPGKRDPAPLFQAVSQLHREGTIKKEDLAIHFYGSGLREALTDLVHANDLNDFVHLHPEVSFRESLQAQQESTVLLLLSWNDPRDAGTLTSKVFSYIGADRPILAIALEDGELAHMLEDTGCGVVAITADKIKSILRAWIVEYRLNGRVTSWYTPAPERISQYTRRAQTERLARLLDQCLLVPI